MSIVASVKDVLSVKLKTRHDPYTDQFSRVLMVKVMMVGALIIGLNWYNDKITCIIPGSLGIDGGFVSAACWINGIYIHDDILYHKDDIGYYGVPQNIDHDGRLPGGHLCNTDNQKGCTAMTKTFFLQYQYMVFFVACMAALYHAPYVIFKIVNVDMISLKGTIKGKSH